MTTNNSTLSVHETDLNASFVHEHPKRARFTTIVDVLNHHAMVRPNKMAFTYLVDGESDEHVVTYAELQSRALAVANLLRARNLSGQTVLLQMESGLEFLDAFFGCLCAGAIAVPSHPHRSRRTLPRLKTIVRDSQLSCVLSTSDVSNEMQDRIGDDADLSKLVWINLDEIDLSAVSPIELEPIDADAIAFLQYTSGSTSAPKGVIVSHGNIIANELMIQKAFGHDSNSLVASWLPLFHDMGLIGNVLQSLYLGSGCVLMSPHHFLEKPVRWLRAVSKYHASMSGGPNFAFDLCTDRITNEELAGIDLSNWRNAFNGAEPIRAETLVRFSARFAGRGFQPKFHYPCYGLAEATLLVAGGDNAKPYRTARVNTAALEQNCIQMTEPQDESTSRELVSCGKSWHQQEIAIVDPDSHTRVPVDRVGEIWVHGPNVCQGYWRNDQATQETFHARIVKEPGKTWLRTGDLGFLHQGELFVTGRRKDMMIFRGRNHYPQDIELTAEAAHPAFRRGGSAAFAIDLDNESKLVILQEIRREERKRIDPTSAVDALRREISSVHELQVHAVLLCNPGIVPKTSSGKVQRNLARQRFLNGEISSITESTLQLAQKVDDYCWSLTKRSVQRACYADEQQMLLEALICAEIQELLQISPTEFGYERAISELGLTDASVSAFLRQIRNKLEVEISEATLMCGLRIPQLARLIRSKWDQSELREDSVEVTDFRDLNRLIEREIVTWLRQETEFSGNSIGHDEPFSSLGLDSLGATSIALSLQRQTGKRITCEHVYEFQTIDSLSEFLLHAVSVDVTPDSQTRLPELNLDQETNNSTLPPSEYYERLNHRFQQFRDKEHYYFHTEIEQQDARYVTVDEKQMLMMASYSYLGLLSDPRVNLAAIEQIKKVGTGAHGSRILAGTLTEHRQLEQELASLMGAEDALVFSSGFMANLATISALVGEGDIVVGDALNHASIADGCKFSNARFLAFRHNDVKHLDAILSANPGNKKLVVVDAVYSMDGDTAPLPEIVKVCKKHHAMLMVDEAHSLGVLGETGRGIQEHYNLPSDSIDIKMGTLSKAIASTGGFIAAKREIVDFLRHHARGFVFSNSLPAPQVAAARACLKILKSEPARIAQLQRNATRFAQGLRKLGLRVPPTESPIVPVIFDSEQTTLEFTGRCRELGLFVCPVFYPAVPMDQPRIRTCVLASHTDEDVDFALNVFAKVKDEFWQALVA